LIWGLIDVCWESTFYGDSARIKCIETDFRETALWSGPEAPLGWRKFLLVYYVLPYLRPQTAEWIEKVNELEVALKQLTDNEIDLVFVKLLEVVDPRSRMLRVRKISKEQRLALDSLSIK